MSQVALWSATRLTHPSIYVPICVCVNKSRIIKRYEAKKYSAEKEFKIDRARLRDAILTKYQNLMQSYTYMQRRTRRL